jgi:hypothetical protein
MVRVSKSPPKAKPEPPPPPPSRWRVTLTGDAPVLNLLPLSASQRTWLDLPLGRPCSE